MSTDCTPRYCYADPFEGGKQAVAETYRNICAVGAKPLAITNCLNFANPQRPEIMAQFVGCLEGMAEACKALDYPIVSGNVSLYNESKATGGGSAILPTPAIGGVGLMEDIDKMMTIGFKADGNVLLCLGHDSANCSYGGPLDKSLWLSEVYGINEGLPPNVDLDLERKNGEYVRQLIRNGKTSSVHDISDGGMAAAIAEMALASNKGARIHNYDWQSPVTSFLFGEAQGRYILEVSKEVADEIHQDVLNDDSEDLRCERIGVIEGNKLIFEFEDEPHLDCSIDLADLRKAHESFFKDWMED